MNKRLPLLLSLIGVILLAASIAYWILQLVKPPQRPIAAVPVAQMPDPPIDAAATLFGGQMAVATATNYQLTGIVAAGRNSVAIIVADGAAPKALRLGKELTPGVTLAEVYPRYVMLSDNGAMKRIDLAPDTKSTTPIGGGAPNMAPNIPNNAASAQPIMPSPVAPAGNVVAEPPQSPGAVSQQVPFNAPGDVGQHDAPSPQSAAPAGLPNAGNNPNQNPNQPNPTQAVPQNRAINMPANPSPALQ